MRSVVLLMGLILVVAGCGRARAPDLMTLPNSQTPDEFSILPSKPLQAPPDLASLPAPTPGGVNLVDPTPRADAIAALGGTGRTSSSNDGALVSYVARYGVTPDIRSSLASADFDFRQRNRGRPLERAFNVNIYYRAYEAQSLDQYSELERFRAAGVPTPAAPPTLSEE